MVKLSAPWVIFYRKINALFEEDKDIMVVYDGDNYTVSLYVNNEAKANALTSLLPEEKEYGNVKLKIRVVPADDSGAGTALGEKFEIAFAENPALSYITTAPYPFDNMTYVVFRKEVVQFFTDDIGDAHGVCSTLYQDIAREVFGEQTGVYFCTDVKEV